MVEAVEQGVLELMALVATDKRCNHHPDQSCVATDSTNHGVQGYHAPIRIVDVTTLAESQSKVAGPLSN